MEAEPNSASTVRADTATHLMPPVSKPKLRKNKLDPFHLPDAATFSAQNSPLASPKPPEKQDNILRRFFITPLLSVSFILALYIVDRRQRHYRAREHPSQTDGASAGWFSGPQPYQFAGDGTWRKGPTLKMTLPAQDGTSDGIDARDTRILSKGEQWIVRKKHRKVARVQMEDAFELRDKLVWVVGVIVVSSLGLLGFGVQKAVLWYFRFG